MIWKEWIPNYPFKLLHLVTMEKSEFLEKHVFNGLQNQNDGFDSDSIYYFSVEDTDESSKTERLRNEPCRSACQK